MELKIIVKDWKFTETADKQKTIAGNYVVRCGGNDVATSQFNQGYDGTKISIPSKLLMKIEAIDAEVRQAIVDNFEN